MCSANDCMTMEEVLLTQFNNALKPFLALIEKNLRCGNLPNFITAIYQKVDVEEINRAKQGFKKWRCVESSPQDKLDGYIQFWLNWGNFCVAIKELLDFSEGYFENTNDWENMKKLKNELENRFEKMYLGASV